MKRVLSRYFGISDWLNDPKTIEKLWMLSEKNTPHQRVADYTQAIMDLGAMVCTRTKPSCDICPIQTLCHAKKIRTNGKFCQNTSFVEKPQTHHSIDDACQP